LNISRINVDYRLFCRKREKDKPGSQVLIEKYIVADNNGRDDGTQADSQKAAASEDQTESGDSDSHEAGASDPEPAPTSIRTLPKSQG
jgi:hypothetical protein